MSPFLLLGLILFLTVYSFVSCLPTVLAWWFKRKFHIQLKIGRIALLPKLIFKDVTLSKDGYCIQISETSFRSSFFNSDINKLVSVVITDLKISNNVEEKRSVVVETILKPLLSKQNSSTFKDELNVRGTSLETIDNEVTQIIERDVLDFRDKKLPQSLIKFAQFMGLHIYNASIDINTKSVGSPLNLHASVSKVHADGAAGGPTRALIFCANLVEAQASLSVTDGSYTVLEAACSLLIEGTVKADGPLNIEKIHASLSKPTVTVHDQLFTLMQQKKRVKRPLVSVSRRFNVASPIERLSPLIPKIFSLKVDDTSVQYNSNDLVNLHFSVQNMQANSRFSASPVSYGQPEYASLPQVYVAFQVDQFQLATETDTYVSLHKLKLDAKLEKGVLNLYLIMNTLSVTYVHHEVFLLYSRAMELVKSSKPMPLPDTFNNEPSPPSILEGILSRCSVAGCVELRGAALRVRARGQTLPAGAAGIKLKLDQLLELREDGSSTPSTRHRSAELLLDGGWAGAPRGGVGAGGAAPNRKQHAWGSAALAVALLKWGTVSQHDSKVEAMMDCLRFEWSESFAKTVIAAVDCINEYRELRPVKQPQATKEIDQSIQSNVSINVALSHINLFLISNESVCMMVRIDAVSIERNVSKYVFVVSGLKVVELEPYKLPFPCQRTEDIPTTFFHVKLARVEYATVHETNSRLLDVQSLEVVDLQWTVNLHLKILSLVRQMKSFAGQLRLKREQHNTDTKKTPLDWRLCFKSDTNLMLILSKENNMLFCTDDMALSYDHEMGFSMAWRRLRLILNGDEILTVDGFNIERLADDPDIRVERKANEGFVLAWNKVWDVNIDSFRLIFPYKHRFADAVQGDFVSTFKWLKAVHNIQKKPYTADSPLPSDLYIKIEEVLIEMSDDPFEVKLRDNYELLEDELKESQKRRAMLDAKVQELCKPHLFLPAGKVEELYDALRQKDAEIYVQRSRAAPPPRSRLVACCLTRLRAMALADPAAHGAAAVERRLRDIDHDSVWSEEPVEWSWLWWRGVSLCAAQWQLLLRDFPQPLLSLASLRLWGALAAAEEPAPTRAIRTVTIDQGAPFGPCQLERSMMPAKFYYDLCCEMDEISYAFGPCWEPVIAQCNIAFDQVSRPSLDPSPPLAWWDKVRLLMHGRLTANFRKFTCLLHVSLDPYNTTEEMEVTWNDLVLDWTNGKLNFLGELNVFVRTASKYDDCRVLRVPALKLAARLGWRTPAHPRDHRAAAPTAPTRLPEYSSNQEHDSYRAFRSQGLDLHLSMDTKPLDNDGPELLLYGSTLRWFESLKVILSGITRPTRRGRVFGAVRPRRAPLSRHYRHVSVSLTLHKLQVFYWSSSSMQRGIEMLGARVTCGSKHSLTLVPCTDGLIRRPRANWTTVYMNCDLNDAEIWLKTTSPGGDEKDKDNESVSSASVGGGSGGGGGGQAMEKCYCVSVRRVSYVREAAAARDQPGHRLAVHSLRGAWTKLNRDLAFALIDTYIKTQQLKKNLSTKALKEEEKPVTSPRHQRESEVVSPPPSAANQSGVGGSGMLLALVAEAGEAGGDAPVVFSDELRGAPAAAAAARPRPLDDDTAHTACLIELVNSQVVLKGCETRGYVLLCAARAEVRQRVRRQPAAAAWSGQLTAMQYYATVSGSPHHENIQWVSVEEIEERCPESSIKTIPDVPRLVGSGHSAGGVIGRTVGPSADPAHTTQLQRIVSRCACEFYYVSQEEPPPSCGAGWPQGEQEPYDRFTLVHHDLDVCTNSLQYAMLLDVVNNVVLHVEPARRRTLELRARRRFQLQLAREHPRRLLHRTQTQVRESLAKLRRLEKEYYLLNRSCGNDPAALEELKNLDNQVNECKETVWSLGEELDAMVRAWREAGEARDEAGAGGGGAGAGGGGAGAGAGVRSLHAPPHRHNEICFKSARWRLTDADGQLGIADLLLTNFMYTKTSRSDDSVEHQLELGYVQVTNLLPNEPFPEVLVPQAPSGRAPLDRRAALRVFCRDRPPVGGISVKEHFEVNIVPIKIGLTKKFFNTMLKFCFPERDPDTIEAMEGEDEEGSMKPGTSSASLVSTGSKKSKKKKDSNSNFYVKRDKDKDDVEKMKERAEKNKLFIYTKIPEVPVRVSYKGSKEKNLEDVRDLPLVLPTLEYHNFTWTWLDLLLAIKSDTRRVILSQAIRQKLQLQVGRRAAAAPPPPEEDKARLLLGELTVAENKPQKKSIPGVFKFKKP